MNTLLTSRPEPDYAALPKDCGCLDAIHTGRHWLHADRVWRESNEALRRSMEEHLAKGDHYQAFLAGMGYAHEEHARLEEKRRHMEAEIAQLAASSATEVSA